MRSWICPLVALGSACGGPPAAEPEPGACVKPSGREAAEFEVPQSRLGISAHFKRQRLARELASQVPRTLARAERQRVGAPGRVSYVIRRGRFSFGLEAGELVVATPLRGEIEVCKPVGPVCLRYGTCEPRWNAAVNLPLDWHEPARANTNVSLSKGCKLQPVGYDATPHVEEVTRKQGRQVARRINRELQRAQQRLLKQLKMAVQPIRVEELDDQKHGKEQSQACLSVRTDSLEYALDDAYAGSADRDSTPSEPLILKLEARGSLDIGCSGQSTLPTPRHNPELSPGVDLALALSVPLQRIERQLNETSAGRVRLLALRSLGSEQQSTTGVRRPNALYVGLDGYQECGTLWLLVQPRLSQAGLRLQTEARGVAAGWLNQQSLPLPAKKRRLETALNKLQDRLETRIDQLEKKHDFEARISSEYRPEIHVGQRELVLLLRLQGHVELHAE